jgi:UDP-3-O-acyl N-acetylglucosamine deacetylase
MIQKTIKKTCQISGLGLHSGKKVNLTLLPAPVNTGIIFIRTDCGEQKIPSIPSSLSATNRATILEKKGCRIITPEHLLATLYGFQIDNLFIKLDAEEVPIMDGSALSFIKVIQKAGIQELAQEKKIASIKKPFLVKKENKSVIALPCSNFRVTFILEYPQSFIGTQIASFDLTPEKFCQEIGPARTYGFYEEVEELRKKGLIKGGSLDNAVVITKDSYLNELRYPNELVRHKILDLIGDLSILGTEINGHFIGIKSGHALNMEMVKKINQII